MSTDINAENLQIIWLGVKFETFSKKIIGIKTADVQKIVPANKSIRRATYGGNISRIERDYISTHIPFRLHPIFVESSKVGDLTKTAQKSSSFRSSRFMNQLLMERLSVPSIFDSVGLLNYDNQRSSCISSLLQAPSVYVPKFQELDDRDVPKVVTEDVSAKPKPLELLETYVREVLLGLQPRRGGTSGFGWNMSHMCRATIERDPALHRLLSRDNSLLPEYLRQLISSVRAMNRQSVRVQKDFIEPDHGLRRFTVRTLTRSSIPDGTNERLLGLDHVSTPNLPHPQNDVAAEMEKDNPEFRRFYCRLLINKVHTTTVDEQSMHMTSNEDIEDTVDQLSIDLTHSANVPDALCRRQLLTILKAAKHNLALLRHLSFTVNSWYEALLHGLFSEYLTVVEDTCLALGFICYQPSLAQTIVDNCQYDVAKDTVSTLLRAIEARPQWYSIYSVALGCLVGCSEHFSIFEAIVERVIVSRQPVLMQHWPDIVFYATKFWKTRNLSLKPQIVQKVIQCLEHCLFNRYSVHPAKRALAHYCRRCAYPTKIITIWPKVAVVE